MKCQNCPTTLIGMYCHNCGTINSDFSRREPLCFEELASIFTVYPTAEMIVERCGDDRIAAIKLHRQITGFGLRESKDIIDVAYFAKYPHKKSNVW